MDGNLNDNATLRARIKELERERDELHKDIEQLCMQQAGPSYIGVPTRPLHRIAGLEQETENLKKKLAACTRENQNLQEELSEAYRIKSQLADLHSAEVSKNIEAEKQLKFFQGCVAAAFAERDHAVMEAEKAKEKEELVSRGFHELQQRIEELNCELLEEKILTATLQSDLDREERLDEAFKEVVHKFYEIRQQSLEDIEDVSWEDKCGCLLHDSSEMWTFRNPGETSTSKYISALEEQVETLRKSLDNLQNKLQMGLEIENHLKKKVRALEKQKILSEEKLRAQISTFHHYHSQHRLDITSLLDEGFSHIKSAMNMVEEKLKGCSMSERDLNSSQVDDLKFNELEFQDVRINNDDGSDLIFKRNEHCLTTTTTVGNSDASKALALALKEKVETLLLLSQQEERHLLERNVNAAMQKKIEELQRNLLQVFCWVTNEKVKALMELAQLKRDHQLLQEKVNQVSRQGKSVGEITVKRPVQEKDGRLKNLLKTSYLRRWTGIQDADGNDADIHRDSEVIYADRRPANSMDYARMKIENATLKESLESMDHLIRAVRRLRLSLLKVKESAASEGTEYCSSESLDTIINEANQLKTALGSSLPLSWSAEADSGSLSERVEEEIDVNGHSTGENMDFVSAAGFEMVELLVLIAQLLKEDKCS
uniref:Liprin-alpha-2 isoform X1 n=1 Tax=Nicotiana tabacum TaxID=4097 RepID=A0A1S4AHD6_TOBAC|nr:PREDICTED: liprin-alpha-2-like isoform X1 [Nicotiana tabacum]XP_016476113.1 PREDICTED: liprin-alpha-2-like isoform X1 [Nicotiana tabacum]XP_016476115.1 PREDICTED: liprin-alpha-2-like isoform X1 [Nicotiana tabacum]